MVYQQEEESSAELEYNPRGFIFLAIITIFSIFLISYGFRTDNTPLILWGFIFLMGVMVGIVPVLARFTASKLLVDYIKERETEYLIQQKIQSYLQKQQAQENQEEHDGS